VERLAVITPLVDIGDIGPPRTAAFLSRARLATSAHAMCSRRFLLKALSTTGHASSEPVPALLKACMGKSAQATESAA